MTLKTNSRQIPKNQEVCANKKYNDVLYSYLQVISQFNPETDTNRWFSKKDINFSKLGEKFGLSRQTVSTRFKNLKEMGLIIEKNKDIYEIVKLNKDFASLIPYKTLRLLVDALSDNAISTYGFLLNEYYRHELKPFVFTFEQIKQHIGICASTRSNDEIIINILFVLERLGLIKYQFKTVKQQDGMFDNVKTVYEILQVSNEVLKIQSDDC